MLNFFRNASLSITPSEGYAPAPKTLRHILAVGAYPESCAYGDDKHPDSRDLTRMADFLIEQGLVRRKADGEPDIHVETVNLRDGQDFLHGRNRCDILMVCYVPGFDRYQDPYRLNDMQAEFEQKSGDKPPRDFRVSEFHYPEQWSNAAARATPKIIWTVGGKGEIGIHDFLHMKTLPMDVIQRQSRFMYTDDREDKPGHHGIPGRWYGVALSRSYSDMVAHSNSPETEFKAELRYRSVTRDMKHTGSVSDYLKAFFREHLHS